MTFYVPLPSTGIEYLRKPITNTEKKCQKVSVFHHKLLNLEFWKGDLASYQTYGHKHSVKVDRKNDSTQTLDNNIFICSWTKGHKYSIIHVYPETLKKSKTYCKNKIQVTCSKKAIWLKPITTCLTMTFRKTEGLPIPCLLILSDKSFNLQEIHQKNTVYAL